MSRTKLMICAVLAAMVLGAVYAAAQDDDRVEKELTRGRADGTFVLDDGTRGSFQDTYRGVYMIGVIDCAYRLAPEIMEENYPGMDPEGIKDRVKKYYRDNPGERTRPVVDVILSGCK